MLQGHLLGGEVSNASNRTCYPSKERQRIARGPACRKGDGRHTGYTIGEQQIRLRETNQEMFGQMGDAGQMRGLIALADADDERGDGRSSTADTLNRNQAGGGAFAVHTAS